MRFDVDGFQVAGAGVDITDNWCCTIGSDRVLERCPDVIGDEDFVTRAST